MMGDALAMALMRQRGFNAEDFARSHPGGSRARLLNRVHHLMRTGDRLPRVSESANVMEAMLELSRTGLGLVAVCDAQQRVVGVFTDGDLRRWLVKGNSLQDPLSPAITRPGYRLPEQWRRRRGAGSAARTAHQRGPGGRYERRAGGGAQPARSASGRHRLINAGRHHRRPRSDHFQSGLFSNCCFSSAFMSSFGLPSHWYLAYFFG